MGHDRTGAAESEHQNAKPSDKYAQSDQMPPPGKRSTRQFVSDVDAEDIVEDAAEDSFPASDPPGYSKSTEDSSA